MTNAMPSGSASPMYTPRKRTGTAPRASSSVSARTWLAVVSTAGGDADAAAADRRTAPSTKLASRKQAAQRRPEDRGKKGLISTSHAGGRLTDAEGLAIFRSSRGGRGFMPRQVALDADEVGA